MESGSRGEARFHCPLTSTLPPSTSTYRHTDRHCSQTSSRPQRLFTPPSHLPLLLRCCLKSVSHNSAPSWPNPSLARGTLQKSNQWIHHWQTPYFLSLIDTWKKHVGGGDTWSREVHRELQAPRARHPTAPPTIPQLLLTAPTVWHVLKM